MFELARPLGRSPLCKKLLALLGALSLTGCFGGGSTDEPLRIDTCQRPGFDRDLRCGTLTVPEDQSNPDGRTLDLNIVVLPAEDGVPRTEAVLYLVGGPGLGATGSLPGFQQFLNELQRTSDIVLVDQRGTGASNALHCDMGPADFLAAFLAGHFESSTLATCLADLDADPSLYTSAEIVSDLDAVREAIGYEQFNLVGISYGSRLALDYLRRYPRRVRTVALRGVASPAGNLIGDIGTASEEAMSRLFDRCATDPGCAATYPDPESTLRRVLSRLEREPQQRLFPVNQGPVSVTLSRDLFAGALRLDLYQDSVASMIPRRIHEADQGTPGSLSSGLAAYLDHGLPSDLSLGSYLSIACSEDLPFFEPTATTPATEPFFFTSAVIDSLRAACSLWPHRPAPPEFKEPVVSDVPVLLMSGSEDPATSAGAAAIIGSHLSNSRHLVTPGLAHFPFWTECFERNVVLFVASGSTSAVDESCAGDYKPRGFDYRN